MPPDLIELEYKIKFEGGDADRHVLEAYPAAQTLEGLTWALAVTVNFAVTGEIRHKGDLSRSAKMFIHPPRRGSVINDLNILVQQHPFLVATVGGYAVNTITPFINGVVGYAFRQAMGYGDGFLHGSKKYLKGFDENRLDKLVTRIEPPLTRAHAVIGKTADQVILRNKRTDLATFDYETKAFMEARISDRFETLDTNITSLNVLTGNGRLYDPVTQVTAPFSLNTNTPKATRKTVILSMDQFSMGRNGTIRLTVQRVETLEKRLKKYVISSAEEIPQVDWINGGDPLRSAR